MEIVQSTDNWGPQITNFVKKGKGVEVKLPDKVAFLKGHQDDDVFTIFTESLETHPLLSEKEIKDIYTEVNKRHDLVIG